ncbi:hypothetical protein FOM02_22180 [Bradyrhizobium sp. SEMIA]|uniref:PAS domain-containing protein n=2 Tax=Nitrobacteraceae TaxID=41294 RepID=A0AAE7NQV2_9BRAD|nr:hypothetical protein FOM02_22180 [Bradyrhizobium sp. SEMIA]QOZ68660.1 hypothetical protein WN72_21785 [Bradyrhizobium arachidis]
MPGLPVRESSGHQAVVNGLSFPAPAFIENFPATWIMCGLLHAGNIVLDFSSAAPSVVKSIRQRDLLNTWLRLYAREQMVPAIWEYQPARLEDELSDLIYYTVDSSAPTPRLTIQSEGTRISRAYGHTGKGVLLDDYIGPRLVPFVMPIYYECVARGLPVYSVADVDDIYGRVVAYERLLLPFQTDGKICHVIASLKTFCEDGGFEIKNLMRGNDALPRPKLRAVIDCDLFHRAPGRIAAADVVEFVDQPGVTTEIIELN